MKILFILIKTIYKKYNKKHLHNIYNIFSNYILIQIQNIVYIKNISKLYYKTKTYYKNKQKWNVLKTI